MCFLHTEVCKQEITTVLPTLATEPLIFTEGTDQRPLTYQQDPRKENKGESEKEGFKITNRPKN